MADTELQISMTDELKAEISSFDDALIYRIHRGNENPDEIEGQARYLVHSFELNPDHKDLFGMRAAMFKTLYLRILSPKQASGISKVLEMCLKDSPLARDLSTKVSELDQIVNTYYEIPDLEDNYWLPEPLDDNLGNTFLNVGIQRKVREARKKFETENKNPNWIIESFVDHKTKMTGVWMSTKGNHFDPARFNHPAPTAPSSK